jgi:cobalt transporter subunit CbtA
MLGRVFLAAVLAGVVASFALSTVQHLRLTPLILAAERLEGSTHEHAAASPAAEERPAWAPADGLERTFYTVLTNLIVGVAFALALTGASLLLGVPITLSNGVLWGVAGFLVFSLSPSAGLPPELPGMPAAELTSRQLWWLATVAATAAGLALLTVKRQRPLVLLALVLLALPHVIGAPQPPEHASAVPAHLAAAFAANSIAVAAVFWVVLGLLIGLLNDRRKMWAPT